MPTDGRSREERSPPAFIARSTAGFEDFARHVAAYPVELVSERSGAWYVSFFPSIVNVPMSSIARESEVVFPTHAGPEIGVASTKAFTSQLTVLVLMAVKIARMKRMNAAEGRRILDALQRLRLAERAVRDVHALGRERIALRVLTEDPDEAVDAGFFARRIAAAVELRRGLLRLDELAQAPGDGRFAVHREGQGPAAGTPPAPDQRL